MTKAMKIEMQHDDAVGEQAIAHARCADRRPRRASPPPGPPGTAAPAKSAVEEDRAPTRAGRALDCGSKPAKGR
jgi:hypothetical protein